MTKGRPSSRISYGLAEAALPEIDLEQVLKARSRQAPLHIVVGRDVERLDDRPLDLHPALRRWRNVDVYHVDAAQILLERADRGEPPAAGPAEQDAVHPLMGDDQRRAPAAAEHKPVDTGHDPLFGVREGLSIGEEARAFRGRLVKAEGQTSRQLLAGGRLDPAALQLLKPGLDKELRRIAMGREDDLGSLSRARQARIYSEIEVDIAQRVPSRLGLPPALFCQGHHPRVGDIRREIIHMPMAHQIDTPATSTRHACLRIRLTPSP